MSDGVERDVWKLPPVLVGGGTPTFMARAQTVHGVYAAIRFSDAHEKRQRKQAKRRALAGEVSTSALPSLPDQRRPYVGGPILVPTERSCFTCAHSPLHPGPSGCRLMTLDEEADKPVLDYCEVSKLDANGWPTDRTVACPCWGAR